MSAASARAFQYPIGSRSRAARPPSGKTAGIAFPASAQTTPAPKRHHQRRGGQLRALPQGAEQEPEGEEGGVDERPVQLRPRKLRRDRPRDREPAPGRRREHEAAEHDASVRKRQPSRQCERPPATGDEQCGDAVQTESPANTAASSTAAATVTATSGLRIAGQASMVAGKPRAPYPRGLTKRLPAAHPDLNAVRETLHNSPHDAGNVRPGLETLIPAAAHEPARGALRVLVLLAAIAAALVTVAPAAAACRAAAP